MSATVRKVKNISKKTTVKIVLQDKKKLIRLYLLLGGAFFIILGIFFRTVSFKQNNTDSKGIIAQSDVNPIIINETLLKGKKNNKKELPLRLLIPAVNIDVSVKEAKVVNGYWQVFDDAAGFGLGSSYPADAGNQVIFAHARDGLFLNLKNIKNSQDIYVITASKWYQYKVIDIMEVLPTNKTVISPTDEAILTLYTCSGYADSKRLVVKAERVYY